MEIRTGEIRLKCGEGFLCPVPNRRMNMSEGLSLGGLASIVALSTVLAAPVFAQDELIGHRYIRTRIFGR
jgi:hypothetical protein